jgi:hypothetical protein
MRKSFVRGSFGPGSGGPGLRLHAVGRQEVPNVAVKGVVEDGSGQKVANATVWLIPAADVATMAKTPIEIKRDAKNDEPLEDNLAANRARYLKAKSGAAGEFNVAAVPNGKYFLYVEPADSSYLPGGDKSRKSLSNVDLGGGTGDDQGLGQRRSRRQVRRHQHLPRLP